MDIITVIMDVVNQEWLTSQLKSNDFLIAAIAASLMYLLRSIPIQIYHFILRQISIEFTLTNEDECYQSMVEFLESKRLSIFSRTYSKKEDSYELTVGYGSSWFWYKGLGRIHREFKKDNHSNKLKEEITVTIYSRSKKVLESILEKSIPKDESDDRINLYISEQDYWVKYSSITKRSIDSVFIEGKENIVQQIRDYSNNKQFYIDKGIPYKLGILLHGIPGTGKTSLLKMIASEYDADLYFISKESLQGKYFLSLMSNFAYSQPSRLIDFDDYPGYSNSKRKTPSKIRTKILIFEDIDVITSAVSDREVTDTEKNEGLSTILNVLDGTLTPDNLIFIMTTNYIDKIDAAILRPGRIDINMEVKPLNYSLFQEMVHSLWEKDKNLIDYEFKHIFKPIPGSVVQSVYIQNKNYDIAKKELKNAIQN